MAVKKIEISKLRVGMRLAKSAYGEKDGKRQLLLQADTMISSESQIRRLAGAGVRTIEIDTETGKDTFLTLLDQKKWGETAGKNLSSAATDAIMTRYKNNFVSSITTTVSNNVTSRNLLKEELVANLLKDIILFVENHVDILIAMVRLKGISEYTYTHSIDTTVLCLSVASSLKLNYTDIKRVGSAVMMADLGMTSFPSRMITRPSGLSKKELEQVKKHPTYSVDFLKSNGISDPLIKTIILQHHERFDGTGYPAGTKGEDIHSISKLCAIADVYNAMTSSRPHRQGLPPHMVNAEILKNSGTQFDPRVARVFIKHIGAFPVGNMVELTSGKLALVADQNKSDPMRPVVVIFQTKRKFQTRDKLKTNDPGVIIARGNWELVDLSTDKGVFGKVKRGLDHRNYQINPNYYLSQV